MLKGFYQKLACQNIKTNHRTYLPYMLTCICTIAMFYIMNFLNLNEGVEKLPQGQNVQLILAFGTWIIAIFAAIFLFYTNSFLIKRRKKELALYNILGMEKRHIGKVLFWEMIVVAVVTLIAGLLLGVLASKLMFLILLKMLSYPVALGFEVSLASMKNSVLLFCGIYLLSYLNNLRQVHIANPAELMAGEHVGEREPKSKWLLTVVGLVCLCIGYYIAITTKSPLQAIVMFFVAVILVMIGTYCLFTSVSIAILKLLRKNKKFYYQTRHFTSVSGMIYRMKQNAVGLANICILSTGVLLMLSTTVCLYVGREDIAQAFYPREVSVQMGAEKLTEVVPIVDETLKEYQLEKQGQTACRKVVDVLLLQEGSYQRQKEEGYSAKTADLETAFVYIPLQDYNEAAGKQEKLSTDEVLLFTGGKKPYGKKSITVDGKTFQVQKELDELFTQQKSNALNTIYMIVDSLETAKELVTYQKYEEPVTAVLSFDLKGEEASYIAFEKKLAENMQKYSEETGITARVDARAANREIFYSIDGGFLFLGIFLGSLFLMGTALIIYYKQVSEGYEDRNRFHIMKKVGMSHREVKASIRSQVLLVFFLPLLTAMVHIAMAFPLMRRLLALLYLDNSALFVLCTLATIGIFAIVYGVIFAVTARTYDKIVNA